MSPRFVELTRVVGGYIVINVDEVLTIKEANTKSHPLPNVSYNGFYSIITFKKPQMLTVLVKESAPEIRDKFRKQKEGDLW